MACFQDRHHGETHDLSEQVQGLYVGDKPEGEEGGHQGGLGEKIAAFKEKRHRKK